MTQEDRGGELGAGGVASAPPGHVGGAACPCGTLLRRLPAVPEEVTLPWKERGERNLSILNLRLIAKVLRVSLADLLTTSAPVLLSTLAVALMKWGLVGQIRLSRDSSAGR